MGLFAHALEAIKEAEIVLEILDARFPEKTRNKDIEQKITRKGKRLVFVLNKCDMIGSKKAMQEKKELQKTAPCYFVAAQKRLGTKRLRQEILKMCGKKITRIAVIGYPNVGKSSVINAIAGRKAARTSAQAGFTRGKQFVKIADNALLIDSPGVIPFEQRSEFELMLVGAKSINQLQDIESAAVELVAWLQKQNPIALEQFFGISAKGKDAEEVLEAIAFAKKKLSKGAKADLSVAAMLLIREWQNGSIKL